MAKILLATEKPFSAEAEEAIRCTIAEAGHDMQLLKSYTQRDELFKALDGVDAVIVRSDMLDAESFGYASSLKVAVRAGAGYDNIDLQAASMAGVCVMNTPGQNANAVAELVLALLLKAARNDFDGSTGFELTGKRIGIVAYGAIGRRVANLAKGFGMEVYAFDPFCTDEVIAQDGVTPMQSLKALFEQCPIVSLHMPATKETKGSINAELLASMPQDGRRILINTARKEVVDELALRQKLTNDQDFHYATDVKPSIDAELSAYSNYYSTPKKLGAQTADANLNAGVAAARQIINYLLDGSEPFRVN